MKLSELRKLNDDFVNKRRSKQNDAGTASFILSFSYAMRLIQGSRNLLEQAIKLSQQAADTRPASFPQ